MSAKSSRFCYSHAHSLFAQAPGHPRDLTRTRRLYAAFVSLRGVRHKLGRFVARETRRPQMTQINTMILKISGRRGKDCGFPRPGDAHPVGVA